MEEYPPHKVNDTKSLVMWLWRIHNHINQELMGNTNLDLNMYGEKESPKIIYPPEKSQHFPRSEDDIFEYLSEYFFLANGSGRPLSERKRSLAVLCPKIPGSQFIILFSGQVSYHEPCMA